MVNTTKMHKAICLMQQELMILRNLVYRYHSNDTPILLGNVKVPEDISIDARLDSNGIDVEVSVTNKEGRYQAIQKLLEELNITYEDWYDLSLYA